MAQRLGEEPANALGQIGAGEELDRVLVFDVRRAARDLRQVGRERGLSVPPRGHVGMRSGDLPPRPEPLARNRRQNARPVLRARSGLPCVLGLAHRR